ncbi:hypothetical protein [Novosphingobium album (ex Liu et al. 2023)]|uniref:Uncharacterized protein n=1 Tax=Novosphingobium album (ex Liu et al. 2023) TaxID=3031130 RepID=A0ABT5WQ24_9SPHN|nr:hypothetical protein [Novosphingobium album (ex Liu et al. 2023)]MDE8652160.1 hypothetical protein [Novosphingobium album (ex Liu et al. 2023)]
MRARSTDTLSSFTVDVAFFSGDERYATETYSITASTWFTAQQQALQMSVSSPFDDPRVPDLRREATERPS